MLDLLTILRYHIIDSECVVKIFPLLRGDFIIIEHRRRKEKMWNEVFNLKSFTLSPSVILLHSVYLENIQHVKCDGRLVSNSEILLFFLFVLFRVVVLFFNGLEIQKN